MKFSAHQIAELLDGEVEGNPEAQIKELAKIEEAATGSLSFLANPAYTEYIYSTNATAVIVANSFKPEKSLPPDLTLIKVEDPYAGFARLLEAYNKLKYDRTGIEPGSFVSEEAQIGSDVYIANTVVVEKNAVIEDGVKLFPHTYIGEGAHIGEGTILHTGVKIYADCRIGKHCIFHGGVVIGADGFGFAPNQGNYNKVSQIGNVVVEDNVEIGSNTTIDRATLGSTFIRKGVKLDNLIQIGHNVEIGENTVIAAQSGIAGSTKIGKNCMFGGQVGITGHITIGDRVKIAAQSGIASNIPDDTILQGSPAIAAGEFKRSYVRFRKLPDIATKLDDLEKELKRLQNDITS